MSTPLSLIEDYDSGLGAERLAEPHAERAEGSAG
jgi:hypothetical protein